MFWAVSFMYSSLYRTDSISRTGKQGSPSAFTEQEESYDTDSRIKLSFCVTVMRLLSVSFIINTAMQVGVRSWPRGRTWDHPLARRFTTRRHYPCGGRPFRRSRIPPASLRDPLNMIPRVSSNSNNINSSSSLQPRSSHIPHPRCFSLTLHLTSPMAKWPATPTTPTTVSNRSQLRHRVSDVRRALCTTWRSCEISKLLCSFTHTDLLGLLTVRSSWKIVSELYPDTGQTDISFSDVIMLYICSLGQCTA